MAEIARALESTAPEEGKPQDYDAFLSYAHRDRQVTVAIQKGLHQIGRRLGQLRAVRVFRDDTNLTASPDLWGKITEALDRSRFMIVVLSPQSAASHWVNEEVAYWLQHRGHDRLMLVLAEGDLRWDANHHRFDPNNSDAAPAALTRSGSLPAEPLYIDVSGDKPWELGDLTFRDKVTALAAPIHGKPKDQLAGDDLREQRRFRRLRAAAVTGLALLTALAVVAAVIAVAKQQEAIRRLHDAVVAKLNAEGAAMLVGATPGGDMRALQELLAANAIEADGVPILNAQIARFTTQKIVDISSTAGRGFQLAYSPDGSRVATAAGFDGTIRQWESATGKPVGSPIKTYAAGVAFTPDGHTIASAGSDGMRLWNADTGNARNPNPVHIGAQLGSIAVSPDGRTILTGDVGGDIRIWDPGSGRLRATTRVFPDGTEVSAFDGSGTLFAAAGRDGSIRIYDTTTGKPHAPIISVLDRDGAPVPVSRIAFSPDGHTIAVGSDVLGLFNADTGTSIGSILTGATKLTLVTAVAFSPDGHRIATGRGDGPVQLWDAGTGAQLGPTRTGHTGAVAGAAFSPDGRQIATVSADGTLRLWNATVGQPMLRPGVRLQSVAFSPDGRRVAASGDTAILQWDVGTGQPRPPSLTPGGAGEKYFAFVDGARIVTAAADGTIQVWDANSGQPASRPVHINILGGVVYLAFRGDGREVATRERDDGTIQLWDVATGRALGQLMTADAANTGGGPLAFSPDGHHLVASYTDGLLRLWNTDTIQPEGTVMGIRGSAPIGAVAFSRDGTTVAAGRGLGAVELWDAATRKPLPNSPLTGHTSIVFSVAFGVGHQLASGGLDDTLRLWDTATGKPTAAPLNGSNSIFSVAISPDGQLAASASMDGTVLLSPAVADPSQLCKKFATNMSHKQWRDWVSPGIGYITLCPGLPIAPD
jgi:WD40 repeat protein